MIEIEAYTLREWQAADTAFVYHSCQDPDIQRWTTVPLPYRPGDAAAFVIAHGRPQPESSSAWFAITRTDSGELLGSISINWFDKRRATGEIGYWMSPHARGQGVLGTVLPGLARWAAYHLGLTSVTLRIAAGNAASRRVAARAGFVEAAIDPRGCKDGDSFDDAVLYRWDARASRE